MKQNTANNGKVDFLAECGNPRAKQTLMWKTCLIKGLGHGKNYENRRFSTKSFPQFQHFNLWKNHFSVKSDGNQITEKSDLKAVSTPIF